MKTIVALATLVKKGNGEELEECGQDLPIKKRYGGRRPAPKLQTKKYRAQIKKRGLFAETLSEVLEEGYEDLATQAAISTRRANDNSLRGQEGIRAHQEAIKKHQKALEVASEKDKPYHRMKIKRHTLQLDRQ